MRTTAWPVSSEARGRRRRARRASPGRRRRSAPRGRRPASRQRAQPGCPRCPSRSTRRSPARRCRARCGADARRAASASSVGRSSPDPGRRGADDRRREARAREAACVAARVARRAGPRPTHPSAGRRRRRRRCQIVEKGATCVVLVGGADREDVRPRCRDRSAGCRSAAVAGGGDDEAAVVHAREDRSLELRVLRELPKLRLITAGQCCAAATMPCDGGGIEIPRGPGSRRRSGETRPADRRRRCRLPFSGAAASDATTVPWYSPRPVTVWSFEEVVFGAARELRVRRVDAAVDDRDRDARPGRRRAVGSDVREPPLLRLQRIGKRAPAGRRSRRAAEHERAATASRTAPHERASGS